ncbi:MAG: hypothetical protein KDA32_11880 [Phycisphaerales bacterium]|nr:hypothetical protein [Phycisphaerales bacterium]
MKSQTLLAVLSTLLIAGCPMMDNPMPDPNTPNSMTPNDSNGDMPDGNDTSPDTNKPDDSNKPNDGNEPTTVVQTVFLRPIYGDGSAGDRSYSGDDTLDNERNLQFNDFSVDAGVTLTIQSGAVLRIKGAFTNKGRIVVKTGGEGGDRVGVDSSTLFAATRPPEPGVATLAAASGEVGGDAELRSGGAASNGLSEFEARQTLRIGVRAGGGGGAGMGKGGNGGGGLTIIAEGAISNIGEIIAEGSAGVDGGGGGGGGVIMLASATSVSNQAGGMIAVRGGAGGASTSDSGAGGGGGGGFVHMIAPEVLSEGGVDIAAGAAGATGAAASITSSMRSGGGGGGASAGDGGTGGTVMYGANADPMEPGDAEDGFLLITEADPTALF